jgi:hypothetical protein
VSSQPAADAWLAVALVARQLHRPAAWPTAPLRDAHFVQDALRLGRLVPLAGGHFDRQRQAVAVTDQVDCRAETAAGPAQGMVRRLTRG